MTGKASGQTIGFRYLLGVHSVLCQGPIDKITRFDVDSKAAWSGAQTGGQILVDAPNLFGGDNREGGVSGAIDIEMGRFDQLKNDYLLAKIGSAIPAFRGVVSAIFRQFYWGNNPYLKPYSFRAQRIHVRQNGITQWYDEKAAIPSDGLGETAPQYTTTVSHWQGYPDIFSRFVIYGTRMVRWSFGGIEFYDLTTKTLTNFVSGIDMPITGTYNTAALALDGTVYFYGFVIGMGTTLISVSPTGGVTHTATSAPLSDDPPRALSTNAGPELYIGVASGGYIQYSTFVADALALRDSCVDGSGNAWGVFQPIGSSNSFTIRQLTGGSAEGVIVGVVTRTDVSAARICVCELTNKFVVTMDGICYFVDYDSIVLSSHVAAPWGNAELPFNNPLQTTFWDGLNEYSLTDGSLIETLDLAPWAAPYSGYGGTFIYDPFNNAIIGSPSVAPSPLTVWFMFPVSNGDDMNPAHVIRECLTDPIWGMGYTDDDIDDASFISAADLIYAEKMGISLLWDKETKIEDFVNTVLKHADAALYVSRTTGRYVLKLIRGDYDESTLITLDESNIQSVDSPSKIAYGELTNSVTVTYWDNVTGKDATVSANDPALLQQQGDLIDAPVQYPGFTNSRNATIAAQRDLRVLSSPLLSCTILADATAKPLNFGDVFKFSWAEWGEVESIMRVTGIAYGTGRNNRVKINCTRDVFDTETTLTVISTSGGWVDPSGVPTTVPEQIAFEAPYYEIVQRLGQDATDAKLTAANDIGFVAAAGTRPLSGINANLYTDSGSGYAQAGVLDFCPSGNLTTNLTKTQTSFVLNNASDLDEVTLGTHVQIGDELMRVDTLNAVTGAITVGRGVLDTVPQYHTAGDTAFFWDVYAGFDKTEYVLGEEVNAKIVTASGRGVLPIAEAIPMTVDLAQRAWLPYAPGDLRINGESYNETASYDGEIAITWKHRDRLLETSGTLIDHTAGDIGPEVGTLYRVRGYIDNVLVHTEDDIAGTSATWLPLSSGLIRVEVSSKRDGVYSFQAASHTFLNAISRLVESGDTRYTEDGLIRVIEG